MTTLNTTTKHVVDQRAVCLERWSTINHIGAVRNTAPNPAIITPFLKLRLSDFQIISPLLFAIGAVLVFLRRSGA